VAYEVEWAASALDHLVEQLEFIARDSPSYAAALSVKAERAAGTRQTYLVVDVSFRSTEILTCARFRSAATV
jgi:hypothetical protein